MEYPKHAGIYAIVNKKNGKRYIGSASNIYGRWRLHKSELRRNKHFNSYLQAAWNKYGEIEFDFTVIEACEKSAPVLIRREQFWLDRFAASLYNFSKNAITRLGYKHTPENRKHMSQKMAGNQNGANSHYHGKLTEADIITIFRLHAAKVSYPKICAGFQIHKVHLSRILTRKVWYNVILPLDLQGIEIRKNRRN